MPENESPLNAPLATPPVSSTPLGSTAGAPTPPAAEWRAPAGSRFAGMTAAEVLSVAQTTTDILSGNGAAPAAAPEPAAPAYTIADDEYLTGAQFKQAIAASRGEDAGLRMAADANLGLVKQAHAADFAKYGTEINALIAQVPANLRTIDNLTRCVKMIRSDHVDEIAHERAQHLMSTAAPTLRPNGGGGAPAPVTRESSLESEKIPQEWKERARAARITEDTVSDFCRANGMTPAQFYKQFDTPMNNIVGEVSQRRQA